MFWVDVAIGLGLTTFMLWVSYLVTTYEKEADAED